MVGPSSFRLGRSLRRAEMSHTIGRRDLEVVDDDAQDLAGQIVEHRLAVDRSAALDGERVTEIRQRERDLTTAPRLDHDAGQLVDRDTQVFDLLDVEPETRGNPGNGEAH